MGGSRVRLKTGLRIVAALIAVLMVSLYGGLVLAQSALGWWVSLNCSTDPRLSSPITGNTVCLQLGVPPKFLYWNGTAWAHIGGEDTTGTTVTLDVVDEVAVVALAGQRSAVLTIPGNVTLSGTLTAAYSGDNNSTVQTDRAWFIDENGAISQTLTFPLGDTTRPVRLGIVTTVPATHLGVKVTAYTSGSASTTIRAMQTQPMSGMFGSTLTGPMMPTVTALTAAIRGWDVVISHALAAYAHLRSATFLFDGVNDEVAIVGGAGQVTFEVPSGGTLTFTAEARMGTGTWVAENVTFYTGGFSTFPARGEFQRSGYSEYRLRVTAYTSGSTTAIIVVSPGAGFVRALSEGDTVAHDAVDAGNPLKIGAKATTSISALTPVANGDRTNSFAGIDGVPIVRPYANLEDRVSAVVGITDGSSTSIVAAQGSGIRFCATSVIISNSSATNVTVDIRDGTAGSVLATFPAAANMGGATTTLPVPLCTTANTAMAADPSASASTVAVTLVGFKTKL